MAPRTAAPLAVAASLATAVVALTVLPDVWFSLQHRWPAVREVRPTVPTATTTTPSCPQAGTPEGVAPPGFVPAAVWRCAGDQTEVTGWTPQVQAQLDAPDVVRVFGEGACPAIALSPLELWVVGPDGQGYRPRVPGDPCFEDGFRAHQFFGSLPWRPR